MKKNCLQCDKEIIKAPTRLVKAWNNRTKYCSRSCLAMNTIAGSRLGAKHTEEAKAKMSKTRRGLFVGENSPNWRGGKRGVNHSIRTSTQYKEWRMSIFERDNFTCKECKRKGGWCKESKESIVLNADHVKPFSLIVRENFITTLEDARNCIELWDLDNGQTLCAECHRKTPTFGGLALKKSQIAG